MQNLIALRKLLDDLQIEIKNYCNIDFDEYLESLGSEMVYIISVIIHYLRALNRKFKIDLFEDPEADRIEFVFEVEPLDKTKLLSDIELYITNRLALKLLTKFNLDLLLIAVTIDI